MRRSRSPPPQKQMCAHAKNPFTHMHDACTCTCTPMCTLACTAPHPHELSSSGLKRRGYNHRLVTRCSLVRGRCLRWCTPPVKKWASAVQRPPGTYNIHGHKWQAKHWRHAHDTRGNACSLQDLIGIAGGPVDNCRNACAAVHRCTVIVV